MTNSGAHIDVCIVGNPEELEGVKSLSQSIYHTELGWMSREQAADLDDEYDAQSFWFLALVDDTPTGAMRIVRDSQHGLPLERFAAMDRFSAARAIECQRLMVLPAYRHIQMPGAPFGIFSALTKVAFHYCLYHRIDQVFADVFLNTDTTPIKFLKRLGFTETGVIFRDFELKEASDSTALKLDLSYLVKRALTNRSPFFSYLLDSEPKLSCYQSLFIEHQPKVEEVSHAEFASEVQV